MKITNPVYFDLKKNYLKKDTIKKVSNKTRDKKIAVFKELKKNGVFFLEKFNKKKDYYIKQNPFDVKIKNSKTISITKIEKKFIKSEQLDDDQRRYEFFRKDFFKNKNILDYGFGWGGFLSSIKKAKNLCGVERRPECINYILKKSKKINVSKSLDRFKNIKFDLITLFHVLEHCPQQVSLLKELKPMLSKKGKIIIEVPSSNNILLENEAYKNFSFWSEHLVLHNEESIKSFLKAAGYKKIKVIFYQRYNYLNYFNWIINGTPGGHTIFKKFYNPKLDNIFSYSLKKKIADTIIAIAS